jgi:hypothetical protein
MNSRFKTIWSTLGVFALALLVSCNDTIPQRSTITAGSSTITCPEGQEAVTDPETGLQTCEDIKVTRPTGAVAWKTDFCACKDTKPVSYGNCTAFCADKNTQGAETLFASFNVTEAISLTDFKNVDGWCNLPIAGDEANPTCRIEAKDEQGNIIPIEPDITPGKNSLTADLSGLAQDKTYVLTLVETISGAKSDSVQLIKFSPDTGLPVLGPLKNAPISQYTCIVRQNYLIGSDAYYTQAYRLHFYFLPRIKPSPIPPGNSHLICHDIFNPLYTLNDDELYPRLETIEGVFNLWDVADPRFYDNDGDGVKDVNKAIIQKIKNYGGPNYSASTNFFAEFTWPGSPTLEEEAGNDTSTQPIGYYMAPWMDTSTYKSFCPNSTHYNGTNPIFKALRDYIQVDTEGLYVGEKSSESIVNQDGSTSPGPKDYILIRETDLKQVWFYLKNNVPTAPDDTTVTSNTIYFYYPLNKVSPYVRTSTQRIYRVRGASELSGVTTGAGTSNGGSTQYPPHDKKIGCVPKF